jgi:DNA-binding transcriptional LysR family regulator
MGRTLQKLRELFDDPLFSRESTGLKPTVKAMQLAKELIPLLTINQYIEKEEFNAATCDKSFSIALPSLMPHSLMLPFLLKLNQIAPQH